jgi:hypothetical protein
MFLGEELEAVIDSIVTGTNYKSSKAGMMDLGVPTVPVFRKDTTDRNRTSPFAFTGNKFEFRMLGSSQNIALPNIVLNTSVAEELQSFAWSPKALNPIAYRFYNTPGKLNTLSNPDMFINLQEFCNQLLVYFPAGKDTDYANAMTACVKVCTKKEDTYKFDFEVFFDMFAYSAFENYKATGNTFSLDAYLYTTKYKQQMLNKSVAKEAALLNFLSTLWRIAHDTTRS